MKKLALALALSLPATAFCAQPADTPLMRGEMTAKPKPAAVDLRTTTVAGVPVPSASVGQVVRVPTVLIPKSTAVDGTMIDATLIDDFISDVAPNARHYPPNFPNRTSEYVTGENLKHLSNWIEPFASAPDASFDVLLRAAKLNIMARNLNLGSDFTLRANTHINRAVKTQPNHPEANFLYGMMLSESGAFKEGQNYLDKAAALGYLEAEQSLAQVELMTDKREAALARLMRLQSAHPNHAQISKQLEIVQGGGYYIWRIDDADIAVKLPQ